MFLLCTFNTMTIHVVSLAEILFNIKILPGPHRKVTYWVKRMGVDWLLCKGHRGLQQVSTVLKRDAPVAWWNVKGSKCKRVQQCKHEVPHNQSVSTCSDRAISSGHVGHYLTVFWCSEGNLREARARLWPTLEEGKSRSEGAFSSTSPQSVNTETVCRPAGSSESYWEPQSPAQGQQSGEKGKRGLVMFVKVQPPSACCTFNCTVATDSGCLMEPEIQHFH